MLRILIAEDEEPIANLIKMNLRRAGYECVWAPDGEKAADLMEGQHFDLVLLDIMLPGINGYELLDYAKTLELPVIFLTATISRSPLRSWSFWRESRRFCAVITRPNQS